MSITRRQFAKSISLIMASSLFTGPFPSQAAISRGKEPIVETQYGKVRGIRQENGVYSFRGIPYAASTAGANRFMAPQKRDPWAGVRDCLHWGPTAPQGASRANPAGGMGRDFARFFGTGSESPTVQSEDCLVLNISTPGLDNRKRPVMVWFHGGGFNIGGSSGQRSDGTHVALHQDVVTVSLNHRLGVLGYCHLGGYDSDFAHSGNAGQLDLIAALEWVRDNIEHFGGDPDMVLIYGESGGGGKVSTLMAMPAARDLYHRSICQSGTANRVPDADEASEYAGQLFHTLDLSTQDPRKLQQVPVEQLIAIASQMEMNNPAGMRRGFVPTANTVDLPRNPIEAIAEGSSPQPFIIGCTKHEASLFLTAAGTDVTHVTEQELNSQLQSMFQDKAEEVLEGYRNNHPDLAPGDLLVRIASDRTRMGSIDLAEAHIRGGGMGTYMYLFTWESPVLPYLKSAHGIDGTFFFDNTESIEITRDNPEALTLAKSMSTAWAHFARHGEPAAPGLPAWPRYSPEKRATMIFSASPAIENDPLGADRKLRQTLGV